MDINVISQLISMLDGTDIDSLEVEEGNLKIKIKRNCQCASNDVEQAVTAEQ